MTKQVSILSITGNPESTLTEVAIATHSEFTKLNSIEELYKLLLSDEKYVNTLNHINLILKVEEEDEPSEYINLGLSDALNAIAQDSSTNFNKQLFRCMSTVMPLLMSIMGGANSSSKKQKILTTKRPPNSNIADRMLIDAHWEYAGQLMSLSANGSRFNMKTVEFVYKSAFLHGLKHAREQ